MNIFERWGLYHINRYIDANTYLFRRLPLQHVTKTAIIISFIIGFGITLLVASGDVIFFSDLSEVITSPGQIAFFIAINIGLIAIEFWLLFHIGFQVVARYVVSLEQELCLDQQMKASLVRAILELNEPNIERFGLSPYRKKTRHYWIQLLLYKMKVILSNFIGKMIARKVLSRLGLRAYAPFISTVITGWWDAWIQGAVLKEVRFRLAGRLYALRLLNTIEFECVMSDALETLIRLIAVRIELFGQYSHNLDYMITELDNKVIGSINDLPVLFDVKRLESVYLKLSASEQKKMAHIAVILLAFKRSRLTQEEARLLSLFHIEPETVGQTKKQFDQLFKNQKNDLLMEI